MSTFLTSMDGVKTINPIIPIREVIKAILNSFSSVISMILQLALKVKIDYRIVTCKIYLQLKIEYDHV